MLQQCFSRKSDYIELIHYSDALPRGPSCKRASCEPSTYPNSQSSRSRSQLWHFIAPERWAISYWDTHLSKNPEFWNPDVRVPRRRTAAFASRDSNYFFNPTHAPDLIAWQQMSRLITDKGPNASELMHILCHIMHWFDREESANFPT